MIVPMTRQEKIEYNRNVKQFERNGHYDDGGTLRPCTRAKAMQLANEVLDHNRREDEQEANYLVDALVNEFRY